MLDKEIRRLEPKAIEVIQRDGHWVKAWDGQILHFFIGSNTTLCGKSLVSHNYHHSYEPGKGRCASCDRKRKLLQQRAEEGSDASR